MVISITSTWPQPLSTPLGVLNPGATLVQTLLPDAAQEAAYALTTLARAGQLSVTLQNDPLLLPIFQEAGGGSDTNAQFVVGTVTSRGIIQLYDAGSSSLKYVYLNNGSIVISDTLPT